MLCILVLAKARSAVPIPAAISAKRATKASAKINATLEGARQNGSWPRRSIVTARGGDAPGSLLAIRPSASTRDPPQYFNSLLSLDLGQRRGFVSKETKRKVSQFCLLDIGGLRCLHENCDAVATRWRFRRFL